MQYQILQSNIVRVVWQIVRRIIDEILQYTDGYGVHSNLSTHGEPHRLLFTFVFVNRDS